MPSTISGTVFQDNDSDGVDDAGDVPIGGVTVFVDANQNGVLDTGGTLAQSSGPVNIADERPCGTSLCSERQLAAAV